MKNKYTGKKEYVEYENGKRVLLDEDDSPPMTDEEWAKAKPAEKMLPPAFVKAMREGRVGRPSQGKTPVSVRLDDDVLAKLKQGGKGWQTRLNAILAEHFDLRS